MHFRFERTFTLFLVFELRFDILSSRPGNSGTLRRLFTQKSCVEVIIDVTERKGREYRGRCLMVSLSLPRSAFTSLLCEKHSLSYSRCLIVVFYDSNNLLN